MGARLSKDERNILLATQALRSSVTIGLDLRDFADIIFEYENLVFDSGGICCTAFLGSLKVLEEIGILKQINRFCGVGVSSVIATCLALGYNITEICAAVENFFVAEALDASPSVSMMQNLLKRFGAIPSEQIEKRCCGLLTRKDRPSGETFRQLYDRTGRELCLVVTKVNFLVPEYLHVKTTPNLPIATALTMALTLPGVLQPIQYAENNSLQTQILIDGTLLLPFPVHVFDGWYLSMDEGSSFSKQITSDAPAFGSYNPKTLGLLTYAYDEPLLLDGKLHERMRHWIPTRPQSKLYISKMKTMEKNFTLECSRDEFVEAVQKFVKFIEHNCPAVDGRLNRTLLQTRWDSPERETAISDEDVQILLGSEEFSDVISRLDCQNDTIAASDLESCFQLHESPLVSPNSTRRHYREINGFPQFYSGVLTSIHSAMKRTVLKPADINRIIGIPTDYISSGDTKASFDDKKFLLIQGKEACIAFLKCQVQLLSADEQTRAGGNSGENAEPADDAQGQ